MRIIEAANRAAITRLLLRTAADEAPFRRRVERIVDAVRTGGDRTLFRFARRFDGVQPPIEVSGDQIRAQAARVDRSVRRAIAMAAHNIERVAARQVPRAFHLEVAPGIRVEQRVEPLASVGCYVPGGRFPLPSSLLMTAVPARVAGVAEVVVVCPRPEPAVMAAAVEAGVTRVFRVGGAHAIAALAYGTGTVPRVDKIVGPGNRYVATAKALIAHTCAIDFYAGPTEVVIVSNAGRPEWIAADLVAQAEHDPDARAVLITWNRPLAYRVARAVERGTRARVIARQSIASHGAIVITRTEDEAIALANRLAPEHLVLDREPRGRRPLVAGSIFIGAFTAQAAGDYAIGSNHVLPTAGAARARGGLSAADFVRVMSMQRLTRPGLRRLAPAAVPLARAEGLEAHARSIEIRLN